MRYAILLVLLLTACAPRFDSNELLLAAQIKTIAEHSQVKCVDPSTTLEEGKRDLLPVLHLMSNYSPYLPNNDETAKSVLTLRKIVDGIVVTTKSSRTYCEEKFKNVEIGADRILRMLKEKEVK